MRASGRASSVLAEAVSGEGAKGRLNLHFARRPDRGPRRPIRKESCDLGICEGSFASYTA